MYRSTSITIHTSLIVNTIHSIHKSLPVNTSFIVHIISYYESARSPTTSAGHADHPILLLSKRPDKSHSSSKSGMCNKWASLSYNVSHFSATAATLRRMLMICQEIYGATFFLMPKLRVLVNGHHLYSGDAKLIEKSKFILPEG